MAHLQIQKEVTQPTLDKIIEIQEKGHVVAIASGRPLPGIRKIADTLKLDKYEGYVLAFNGGRIVDYKTGEVVYQACVDNDIARRIYDYCVKRRLEWLLMKEIQLSQVRRSTNI